MDELLARGARHGGYDYNETYKWDKRLRMGRNTPRMQELWWVERITGERTNGLLSAIKLTSSRPLTPTRNQLAGIVWLAAGSLSAHRLPT